MSDWAFLNKHRIRHGRYASTDADGFQGAFTFALPGEARRIYCIASDGRDCHELGLPRWEHVSVSFGPNTKTPTWEIMDTVKNLFWEPEAAVLQLHPPRSRWINQHPGCLHLWRFLDGEQPLPPDIMVGIQGMEIRAPK